MSLRAWTLVAVALAALPARAALGPPEGEPFAVESGALVPVDGESALTIVGLSGRIQVVGQPRSEVRVNAMLAGSTKGGAPVGFWQVGSRLYLAPPPGDTIGARVLRIEVPAAFAVTVEAKDADVAFESIQGSVEVRGADVRVTAQLLGGELTSDQTRGSLVVLGGADVALRTQGTSVELSNIAGSVRLAATGASVKLSGVRDNLDGQLEDAVLTVEDLGGSARLTMRGGSAGISGLSHGGELDLAGTALHLKGGDGDLTVSSDGSVQFESIGGTLRAELTGGTLRGKGSTGSIEVNGRGAEINVEGIAKGVRLRGGTLRAGVVDVGTGLDVEVDDTNLVADRISGTAAIRLDGGSLSLKRVVGAVSAQLTRADARILDGNGPVQLDLDGGDAEVSWASLGGDKDSQIVATTGSVTASFPVSGSCRVEAKSKYGRVESELPTVRALDDDSEAQGPVNGGYRPVVRIVANGDVHLRDATKAAPAD